MKVGNPIIIPIEEFHEPYVTPPLPPLNEIVGHDLPKKSQKWARPILPTDEEFARLPREKQVDIIKTDLLRRMYGYWFMNNGVPTYITGSHYLTLTHWYMAAVNKDGYPDYRSAARIWFYVKDIADNDPNCFGLIMMCQKRFGKCLDIDTDIPTPLGWVKMGDLKEGDYIFGSDGKPTKVVFDGGIKYWKKCYKIVFSDGSEVIADGDHRWLASDVNDRAHRLDRNSTERTIQKRIVTTDTMLKSVLTKGGTSNWSIENCAPVEYTKKELAIPPYIFGAWLGDGSCDGAMLTNIDEEIKADWFAYGESIGLKPKVRGIKNGLLSDYKRNAFVDKIKELGVYRNKHIPQEYLQASTEDRIALLRGLMDTDGTAAISKKRNSFSFCNKNSDLVLGVKELIESLGIKATLRSYFHKEELEPTYYLSFLSYKTPPFKLSRKLANINKLTIKNSPSERRFIRSITPVESRPVKCIQVDNEDHTYLCTKSYIVTHNTEYELADMYNKATRGGSRVFKNDVIEDSDCLFGLQSLTHPEARNNLFKGRLMRSHMKIQNYLKPVSNETGKKTEIVGELTFKGENLGGGKYKAGLNNVIDHRPTVVSAYQGKRPRQIFLDEPGSLEEMDLIEWWTTVKQQLALGTKAFGKAFLPTTLESMKPRGAEAFQTIWKASDPNKRDANGRTESGLYRYFKPQYYGREDFIDEYGNDLVDAAKQFRQNELDNASPDGKRKIKRQFPETVEEAFDVDFGGGLDADVIEILKQRKREILAAKTPRVGYSIYEYRSELHANPIGEAKEEDVVIFEFCKPVVDYRVSVDGTGTTKETSDSSVGKSKYSVIVTKLFDPDPQAKSYCDVAEWIINPDNQDQCFLTTLLLCQLYNKYDRCKILPEGNIGTAPAIVGYYKNRGALGMMLKQPKYLGSDSKETHNRYCFYRDGTVLLTQIFLANQAIRMYGHNLNSVRLIDDLIKLGKSNVDLASAFLGAILAWGGFANPNANKPKKPMIRWITKYEYVGGIRKPVLVKVGAGTELQDPNTTFIPDPTFAAKTS